MNNNIIHFLIVDDEKLIAKMLKQTLEFLVPKCVIDIANSLSEGLDKLDAKQFDVIISDFELGDGTGLTLMLKAKKAYPSISFVLMSGGACIDEREALQKGACSFLEKPINLTKLESVVRSTTDIARQKFA